MSFIYSRALEAAFSQVKCSDTDALLQSSGSPTHKLSLSHDKTMEPSRLSRFGMTCKPLTESHGKDLLTWFAAVSRAKTLAQPEKAQESTANDRECGDTWPGSLAKYDPDSCSWKTAQFSLLGGSEEFLETWPRWGLMRNGVCWEQPTLGRITKEKESGSWPTPTAQMDKKARGNPLKNAEDTLKRGFSLGLPEVVAWRAVGRTWPTATATATAYKGWSPKHNREDTDDRLDYTVEREAFNPGQQIPPMRLNPAWVEWLMGWPIGHTALKPSETAKCPNAQPQHGVCLEASDQ